MFARINFLLGLGLLIQITFYFAGVYLLVRPSAAYPPGLFLPPPGIAILSAVWVTLLLLFVSLRDLLGVAPYAAAPRLGIRVG